MQHPLEELYRLRQLLAGWFRKLPEVISPGVFQHREIDRVYDFPAIRAIFIYEKKLALNQDISFTTCPLSGRQGSAGLRRVNGSILQDYDLIGDYRYLCVQNRLQHLPWLALENSKESLAIFRKHLLSWVQQQPVQSSVVWTSGIEVAIRGIQLVTSRLILGKNIAPECKAEIDAVVGKSLWILERNLSLYSSANNHLLAELLGIVFILSCYSGNKSSIHGLVRYRHLFEEAFLNQTNVDGFSKEQSFHYHAEVMEYALVYLHVVGDPGDEFMSRLSASVRCFSCFLGIDRQVPNIGDSDDGYLFLTNSATHSRFDCLESYANSLLGTEPTQGNVPSSGSSDYLLSVLPLPTPPPVVAHTSIVKTRVLEHSGYFIHSDEEHKLIFDFGHLGLSPLCAHGHADLFSFLLNLDGTPVVVDSGTFQYHSRFDQERSYFRGSSAHNCIFPEGTELAEQKGRMQWWSVPKVQASIEHLDGSGLTIECSHDGFERVNRMFEHACTFQVHPDARKYTILHQFPRNEGHKLLWNLHFSTDAIIDVTENLLVLGTKSGETKARLIFYGTDRMTLDSAPVSMAFGSTHSAPKLVIESRQREIQLSIEVLI